MKVSNDEVIGGLLPTYNPLLLNQSPVMPPAVCSIFSSCTGALLVIFSKTMPYSCSDCPMAADFYAGIPLTIISAGAALLNILYCSQIHTKRQKEKFACIIVCLNVLTIAGVILNITGTVLFSRICPNLNCSP